MAQPLRGMPRQTMSRHHSRGVGAAGDFFIGSEPGDLERAIERDRRPINLQPDDQLSNRFAGTVGGRRSGGGLRRVPLSKKVAPDLTKSLKRKRSDTHRPSRVASRKFDVMGREGAHDETAQVARRTVLKAGFAAAVVGV